MYLYDIVHVNKGANCMGLGVTSMTLTSNSQSTNNIFINIINFINRKTKIFLFLYIGSTNRCLGNTGLSLLKYLYRINHISAHTRVMSTNLDWDHHIITTCVIVRQTLGNKFSKISRHNFEVLQSVTQKEEVF